MTHSITKTCAACGTAFLYERGRTKLKYCSDACHLAAFPPGHQRRSSVHHVLRSMADAGSARRKWLAENRERLLAYRREHYRANKAAYIARAALRAAENPEATKAAKARYAATPRGKDTALESVHRRRARVKGARGTHTREQFRKLVAFYENKCLCCRDEFPTAHLEEDHVVPIAMGGNNTIYNLQPLCQPCNRRKADKHQDFRPTWENYL